MRKKSPILRTFSAGPTSARHAFQASGAVPRVQPDRLRFDLPPGERDGRRAPLSFPPTSRTMPPERVAGSWVRRTTWPGSSPSGLSRSNCRVGSANVVGAAASMKLRPSEGGWPAGDRFQEHYRVGPEHDLHVARRRLPAVAQPGRLGIPAVNVPTVRVRQSPRRIRVGASRGCP